MKRTIIYVFGPKRLASLYYSNKELEQEDGGWLKIGQTSSDDDAKYKCDVAIDRIYPSEYFDDIICEDDIFISSIRYDGKPIEFEEDGSDPYGSDFKLLTKDEDGWSDHH